MKSPSREGPELQIMMQAIRLNLGLVVATVAGAPDAVVKRTIAHEDLWLTKRVGPPVPSPDGKWACFR